MHAAGVLQSSLSVQEKCFTKWGMLLTQQFYLSACPRARAEVLQHRSFHPPLRPSFWKINSQELITFKINSKLKHKKKSKYSCCSYNIFSAATSPQIQTEKCHLSFPHLSSEMSRAEILYIAEQPGDTESQ